MTQEEKPVRVLYLDLDGTVRKGFDELHKFVNKKEDVEVFEEVLPLLKKYRSEGWRIVAISNQGGVALGHLSFEDCSDAIMETYNQCEGLFDKMTFCIHHPEAKDPEMAVCWCRKPAIGMIVESALALGERNNEYYPPHLALFVGDREEDRQCAEAANIKFMDAKEWRSSLNK